VANDTALGTCATAGVGSGGASSTATGGDINIVGGVGDRGFCAPEFARGGNGAGSYWGDGGRGGSSQSQNTASNGNNGGAYGAGGGGGAVEDAASGATGGAGANGIVVTLNYTSSAGDLAEWYETKEDVGPGDVVAISRDFYEYNSRLGLQKSSILEKAVSGNDAVVGVVSSVPYMTIGGDILGEAKHPSKIALAGRVPVKVSEENGKILAGDLLTVSSKPGVAMRSTKAGVVVGRALEDSECLEGEECKVLAMVHTSYTTGALLKVAYRDQGIALDEISSLEPGRDIARAILAQMLQEKQKITAETELSEILTDRIVAGLEIITPRLVADTVVASRLEPVEKDIELALGEDGKLILSRNASGSFSTTFGNTASQSSGTPVITFDSSGNAVFLGEVSAKRIAANEISGLEILTEKLSTLSSTVATLSETKERNEGFDKFIDALAERLVVGRTIVIKSEESEDAAITLSASGDAEFSGAVRAKKLAAEEIQVPGLSLLASTVDALSTTTTVLKTKVAAIEEALRNLPPPSPPLQIYTFAELLTAEKGITVSGLATLNGGLLVERISSPNETLALMSDAIFFGRPYFTGDTGGFALIPQGERRVDVKFEREYIEQPVISATLSLEEEDIASGSAASSTLDVTELEETVLKHNITYLVTRKSTKGFTILLNKPAPTDLRFSWIALAVKNAKTFTLRSLSQPPTPAQDSALTSDISASSSSYSNASPNSDSVESSSTAPTSSQDVSQEAAGLSDQTTEIKIPTSTSTDSDASSTPQAPAPEVTNSAGEDSTAVSESSPEDSAPQDSSLQEDSVSP